MERRQQSCVASSVRRNGIEVWYIMEVNLQVSFNVVSMVVLYYFKIMAAVLLSVYLNTIFFFWFLSASFFYFLSLHGRWLSLKLISQRPAQGMDPSTANPPWQSSRKGENRWMECAMFILCKEANEKKKQTYCN